MVATEVLKKRSFLLPLVLVLIIGAAVAAAGYFYFQYQKASKATANLAAQQIQESKKLVAEVGKLIELPSGEDPTIATVSDKTKLSDQPFFKNSENGDKVLIYTKSKKAILYRPSTNKIIEVAPVSLGEGVTSTTASASPSPTAKPATFSAVVLNGTTTAGLANSTKTEVEQKVTNVKVTKTGDANGDYTKTIIVDLNNNPTVAKSIVDATSGEVGPLPQGESKPSDADFLIIVGK